MPRESRRILALETSGLTGSVAVADDFGLCAATALSGEMRHAADMMPAIDGLLKQQGWPADSLTDVFVSIGPGSFAGLRIGVTIARTLGWSVGCRITAVPTLDGLALNALLAEPRPEHVAVVLDAKRSQVYTAAFTLREGTYATVIGACLADPREFLAGCPRPLAVLGEGVPKHRPAIDASGATVLDASLWSARAENVVTVGRHLADQGRFTPPGDLVPLYVRRPEMEERWEQRQAKARPSTTGR